MGKLHKSSPFSLSIYVFLLLVWPSHGAMISSRILDRIMVSGSDNHSSNYLTTDALWFNQTLDHFSPYVEITIPSRLNFFLSFYYGLNLYTVNGRVLFS